MRKIFLFTALLFVFTSIALADVHRVGTYNIRFPSNEDKGDLKWENRRDAVGVLIKDTMQFDVLALQEVSNSGQWNDLKARIGDTYTMMMGSSYGVALAYRTSKYECVDKGSYKLVPSPKPAGWEALQTRWTVWAKLKDKESGEILVFGATHQDLYPISIREGSRINAETMRQIAGDYPCVITGDMNCTPEDRDAHAYYMQYFGNARNMSKTPPQGSFYTFASGMDPESSSQKMIDYIYVHNVEVESYISSSATLGRSVMPSDHRPVMCEITLLPLLHPTTHVVSTVEELREAARSVQAGDIIYLNDGLYDIGDSALTLANTCVVESSAKAVITGANQIFKEQQYASYELRGVCVKDATCPSIVNGAVISSTGNYLKLSDCRIENCTTEGYGMIYADNCKLDMDHCLLVNDTALSQSSGVYMISSTGSAAYPLTMTHCLFRGNASRQAPALYFSSCATAYLYGNSFIDNMATLKGAVFIDAMSDSTDIRLVNNTFARNRIDAKSNMLDAQVGGAAIWHQMAPAGSLTLVNNTIVGNYAACRAADGTSSSRFASGAVQSFAGQLRLYYNIIAGNYSSCTGRGDVSMTDPESGKSGMYNVFTSRDNSNFKMNMFDFAAADYTTGCAQLVDLLGGQVDSMGYKAPIYEFSHDSLCWALSPRTTQYAGKQIAVLTSEHLSAETVGSDIMNVGSNTGTLKLDQSGDVRLSPSVPGAMEAFVEPTPLAELKAESTMVNQNTKILINGHLYIVKDGRFYNAQGLLL